MNFLRAGFKRPELAHILFFRRSTYIKQDLENIPETTTLEYENTTYRIFINDDSEFCTYCKKHGYKIEVCRYKKYDDITR